MIKTDRSKRRIPLSRRSHVVGFQPLVTGVAEHESALERDFVTLTSFLDARASISAQPVTLTFRHENRLRRYTPDFLVRRSDGSAELVEVKYQADLDANEERLRPAFAEARAWSSQNGAQFRPVTEREIRGSVLENAKRLLPLRRLPIDPETRVRVLTTVVSLGSPSFGHILEALPGDRATVLAAVWRLIAHGALRVDLARPIELDTRVTLP